MSRNVSLLGLALLLLSAVGCDGVAKLANQPAPEIVGEASRDGTTGFLDYTVWIDCTVRNNGADGDITVEGELRSTDGFWNKRATVFVAAGAEAKAVLEFSEATLLNSGLDGYQYGCSA